MRRRILDGKSSQGCSNSDVMYGKDWEALDMRGIDLDLLLPTRFLHLGNAGYVLVRWTDYGDRL